jgi:hypothetical protein
LLCFAPIVAAFLFGGSEMAHVPVGGGKPKKEAPKKPEPKKDEKK